MKTAVLLLVLGPLALAACAPPWDGAARPQPGPLGAPAPEAAPGRESSSARASLEPFGSEAELLAAIEEAQRVKVHHAAPACQGAGGFLRAQAPGGRRDGTTVVKGRVHGPGEAALEGAQVTISASTFGTLTTAAGSYRLSIPGGLFEGKQKRQLSAALIGYGVRSLDLELSPGDSIVADFLLCPEQISLEAVAVTGAAAPEAVTNVQHAGVDEGGIVKVRGDYLVILRRGRLFTVDVGEGRLRPISAVDAYAPGIDGRGTWYDELLVSGDNVVVVGYSYSRRGTEIGLFHMDARGRLRHRDTYHLRSNDYYSSRNYSSRLIGTRLMFYTPLWIRGGGDGAAALLPAMRRWELGAAEEAFRPITTPSRVYRPGRGLEGLAYPVLHTMTVCDLAAPELACEATAVLGPSGRVFYVSPAAVYVWVSSWDHARGVDSVGSMVYRIPLDGAAPSALRVAGTPVDQFSFLESDGHLNVLVRGDGYGDWMWGPEFARGSTSLLRVPLAHFGDGTRSARRSAYRSLPTPAGRAFHNRFIGQHLLYGTGSGWGHPEDVGTPPLYAVRWRDGAVAELSLPHPVDRIEVMGRDAVVIGADTRDLHFTGIDLRALPSVAQHYVRRDAAQGELRSHGFFYRPDAPDAGIIGLPIRGPGRPGYAHLDEGSASILFLRNRDARFRELGELVADAGNVTDDGCIASCVDWYGNARPLFLHDRIFSLLGYEIVEGELRDGRIRELRRVTFAPRPAALSRND